uniref:Uncharacterized protein n=1 Tax=Anguilla anguilla TaxID=7936 RepID=A0A0E9P8T9_ANGAN
MSNCLMDSSVIPTKLNMATKIYRNSNGF